MASSVSHTRQSQPHGIQCKPHLPVSATRHPLQPSSVSLSHTASTVTLTRQSQEHGIHRIELTATENNVPKALIKAADGAPKCHEAGVASIVHKHV